MKKIRIQQGIRMPSRKRLNQDTAASMKLQDSVLFPNRALAVLFQRHAKEVGIKISTRRTKTDKYRCWRVS